MKKILSLIFTIGLVLGCLVFLVSTADAAPERPYNLSFALSSDGTYYRVTDASQCTEAHIVIPTEYNNKPVKGIGDYAFYDNATVKSVVIPDTIESIGMYAFYSSDLEHLELGNSITYIGDYAFSSCSLSDPDLKIPDSVVTIGSRAFQHCGADNLMIGKGLQNLGDYAFSYSDLDSILVDAENRYFCSENGVLYDKNKETLIAATKNTSSVLTIPDSVKTICEDAFYRCKSLTEVTIPASVENFEINAFYLCINLNTVFIHCNVGKNAFVGCDALDTVILYDTVTFIDKGAFGDGDCIDEVFYIGTEEQAQQLVIAENNNNLQSADWVYGKYCRHYYMPVEFDGSAYSIQYICSYCGRSEYRLNNQLSIVDGGVCGDYVKWALINDGTLIIYGIGKMYDYNIDKFDYAPWFAPYRDEIKRVHITWGVTSIGDYAFWLLLPLEEITIANTVTQIGCVAFQGFDEVDKIVIPDSVTKMEAGVFYVNNIQEVVLSNNLTEIASDLLSGCLQLKEVEIPEGVTTIYDRAFWGCENMKTITLPQSLAEIHSYGLSELGIEDISFPANLKFLGDYALADCKNLANIYFAGPAPVINKTAFSGVTGTVYYYPDDTWTEDVRQNYGGNITWVALEDSCKTVILPDLTGYTPEDALAVLQALNLSNVEICKTYHKTISADSVINTLPVAGTTVKTDAAITILVSKGPEFVTLPDVILISEMAAILRLGRLGFTNVTVEYKTEYYSYGNVLETTPAPGEVCQKDVPIILTVVMPICEHKYSTYVIEPDCNTAGYTFESCDLCGVASKTDYKEPLGHDLICTEKVEATCTKTGYVCYSCNRNGCVFSTREILPVSENHSWDEGTITVPPTCSQSGVLSSACTECGGTKTDSIAPTEIHIYGEWLPLDADYHQHLCTTCQVPESQVHSWDDGKLTQAPTGSTPGIMTYSCTVCHTEKTEEIEIIPGDFDGNNVIDNKDVEYLLWYTLFPEDYTVNAEFADFNGDGAIDNLDVEYLLWHTLFPEDFPLNLTFKSK